MQCKHLIVNNQDWTGHEHHILSGLEICSLMETSLLNL